MNRPRHRHHHHPSASSSILSKDPFGLVWLGLLYLAVLVAKWWYISPDSQQDGNCVGCVVFITWFLSLLVSVLLSMFWIFWTEKSQKNNLFIFIINVIVILCTVIVYKFDLYVIAKLYYAGSLNWQEAQAQELFDSFVPHVVGLYMVTALIYSMLRVVVCRDLEEKFMTVGYGVVMILVTVPLVYIGLVMY